MKWKAFLTMGWVLCLVILMSISASAVPLIVQYQGKVTDPGGGPITDPALSMTFSIYAVETSGSPLWEEDQTVDVDQGIYNVGLGTGTTVPKTSCILCPSEPTIRSTSRSVRASVETPTPSCAAMSTTGPAAP